MGERRVLKVNEEDKGKRLDLYLAKNNNDLTRSFIKNVIESNKVLVNGEVEYRANYKVRLSDEVEFEVEFQPQNTPKAEKIPIDIVYEDKHLLVINKPVGMVVHPGSGHWEGTLVNALLYHFKNAAEFEDKSRSGLIHRLDKDTSGLLLVAKTNEGLNYYSKLFAERKVSKQYLAVSYGDLPKEIRIKGKISVQNELSRSKNDRKKYTVVEDGGKFAHTDFEYLGTTNNFHLFKADLKTGRTHQIRVHLSHLGLPILGDIKYGKKKYTRLMLHAWKVSLVLFDGKEKHFEAKPPIEFQDFLNGKR